MKVAQRMLSQAVDIHRQSEWLDAALLLNSHGDVCITFEDPVYVHADAIYVDAEEQAIYALIYERPYLVARVSAGMASAFIRAGQVLLAAVTPGGGILELTAPVIGGPQELSRNH